MVANFQSTQLSSEKMLVLASAVPTLTPVAASPAPVAVPQVPARSVAVSSTASTVPVNQIRFIDPNLAAQIILIRPPPGGVPLASITVPVAPTADVGDGTLFQDPADPAKHYYLPSYSLAVNQTPSGQPRYAIAIRSAGSEWTLTVSLTKSPPASIGDAARAASEIKHSVAVLLRYKRTLVGSATLVAEETFTGIEPTGNLLNATLRLTTLAQRDLVVRALSEAASGTELIVRRSIDVAIPAPPPLPPQSLIDDRPRAMWTPMDFIRTRDLRPSDAMPMVALRESTIIQEAAPPVAAPPPTPVPLFRPVTRVLDDIVEPADFTFPMALHPYIYGDLGAPAGADHGLVRQAVQWRGADHSYYQDPADTWIFYYLPDSFKLARRAGPTREPLMSLRYIPPAAGATGDPLEATRAILDYIAVPVVDAERLADATVKLKPFVLEPRPAGVDGPQFAPLVVAPDRLKLRLALPGASGFSDRPQALVNLRSGIKDTIDLSLTAFQPIFDALFGAGLTLFTGEVAIDLGGGAGESVPFAARFEDMSGDVVDISATPQNTGMNVKLRNDIESPISVARLGASLRVGNQVVPATVSGADFSKPIGLAPAATFDVLLTPATPLGATGAMEAVLDLSGITVATDREAVYNEIVDPTTPSAFSRSIHVVTDEVRFKAGAEPPARIVVEFEGGSAVDLHPGHVDDFAEIKRPIADFLLHRTSTGTYRYRLQTLPSTGGAPVVSEWRDGNSDIVLV